MGNYQNFRHQTTIEEVAKIFFTALVPTSLVINTLPMVPILQTIYKNI